MRASVAFVSAFAFAVAATAAAAEPARNSNSAAPGDKMICKRFLRTGSLVDGYRTCKTKKEWDREHDNLQQLQVTDSCRDRANGGAGCAG
jgi:hypothetical protein